MTELSERVLNILEWDSILKELSSRCATSAGRDFVSSIRPLPHAKITEQQEMISEIKYIFSQGESPDFKGISDIAPAVRIAGKGGTLSLEDLYRIKEFVIASNKIINFLIRHREGLALVSQEFRELYKLEKLKAELVPSITESMELNESIYSALKNIKGEINGLRQEIEKKLNSIIYSPRMDKILQEKIYTTRNERYVIPVRMDMKGSINGTVHDISSSGATIYVEPDEIAGFNSRLIMMKLNLQIEINKILKILSGKAGEHADEIIYNLEKFTFLDFITASSYLSISINGNKIEISDDFSLNLRGARHPLLYLMNPGRVIANYISLGEDCNCLIISGANTGGKTVLLKTIGLCVLLAMHGLHIPAGADSKIGHFTGIFSDIGDDQNIRQSLSSFSGQIVILNNMIEKSDKGSLILIDEIIASTDPRQGAALAQSILENLVRSGAKIVVTTHYPELKELAASDGRFRNASVSFDVDSLTPTYYLHSGLPGPSYAFEIAKTYGIPETIISRSKELLDTRQLTGESLLENLQKHRLEIEEEKRKTRELKEEAAAEKNQYLALRSRLKIKMEEIKHEKGIEFLEELKIYRNQITKKIDVIRNSDLKSLTVVKNDIADTGKTVAGLLRDEASKRFLNKFIPFDSAMAGIGDPVFIIPLEREGKLETIDINSESAVIILGNSVNTRYKFSDLMLPIREPAARVKHKPQEKINNDLPENKNESIPQTIQTRYNTVDLRGMTVNDALRKTELEFDIMARSSITAAVVIHGHGTGALKEAVRSYLKHSFYVNSFRPGGYGEGGDGVTIVELRV